MADDNLKPQPEIKNNPPPEETLNPDLISTVGPSPQSVKDLRIGQYLVLRELGEGGMGMVYLGARDDQEFKKHVAIKVVRKGMDSNEIVARFRRERQILASLDHPSIAKLLDGGTTEDGLTYFVMEHIQGRPLTDYCDSHKLTIKERLELFRGVCSAVQYAHQNLVVHRDLKPGNILVTADGTVKLLDFGIAKLLNPDIFSGELPPTAADIRVMTPQYASPEQARGDPITTASDVYSLGVILYELVSGRLPYRFKTKNQMEIFRVINEEEPGKPSTAVTMNKNADTDRMSALRSGSPDKLQKQLRGDLDNIILMSIRKEPQRRYPSAEAFSEDIRMYLSGHPVRASKGTLLYRANKYLSRHKAAITAAAIVLLLLLVFTVTAMIQNVRIASQRDLAEYQKAKANAEAQKAEKVTQFLINLFAVNDPAQSKGETITAREILDQGATRIRTELSDQPETQVRMLLIIGQIYTKIGLYDQARPLLEEALQKAKKQYGEENAEVTYIMRNLSQSIFDFKDFKTQENILRKALAIDKKLFGEYHLSIAEDLLHLGENLDFQGHSKEAEKVLRQALTIRRKITTKDENGMANNLRQLGEIVHNKGDLVEAETLKRESLALYQQLYPVEHPEVVQTLDSVARVLHDKGDFEGAEKLYRQVVTISRKMYSNDSEDVAIKLNNLGFLLYDKGDLVNAQKTHLEALAIRRKLFIEESWEVAQSLTNLAFVLHEKGELREAEKLQSQALATWRKVVGNDHPRVARSAAGLGEVLLAEGKVNEAISLLREALRIPENMVAADHRYRAEIKCALGASLVQQQKYDEAEPLLVQAHQILAVKMKGSRKERLALQRVIDLYQAWEKPEKAEQYRKLLKTS